MVQPKPVVLTQVDAEDYDGLHEPQPLLVVGDGVATGTPVATAAELAAGTVTDARLFTPKLIHDEIARQIAAIA